MKFNFSLLLKSISLILIIVAFFLPLYYFNLSNNFTYIYINDLYTVQDNDVSIFTYYYLFVAFIILFGIVVDYFRITLGSFQKVFASINLSMSGSYITLSLFFLFEAYFDSLYWRENYFFITPTLFLVVLSAILFIFSFFFSYKSYTKKTDNQKKNNPLPYEQLAKLKKLYDEKVLTEEEFIAQKKLLMEL
jgi:hypothetical protein